MYNVGGFSLPFYVLGLASLVLSGISICLFNKTIPKENDENVVVENGDIKMVNSEKKVITTKDVFMVRTIV